MLDIIAVEHAREPIYAITRLISLRRGIIYYNCVIRMVAAV